MTGVWFPVIKSRSYNYWHLAPCYLRLFVQRSTSGTWFPAILTNHTAIDDWHSVAGYQRSFIQAVNHWHIFLPCYQRVSEYGQWLAWRYNRSAYVRPMTDSWFSYINSRFYFYRRPASRSPFSSAAVRRGRALLASYCPPTCRHLFPRSLRLSSAPPIAGCPSLNRVNRFFVDARQGLINNCVQNDDRTSMIILLSNNRLSFRSAIYSPPMIDGRRSRCSYFVSR